MYYPRERELERIFWKTHGPPFPLFIIAFDVEEAFNFAPRAKAAANFMQFRDRAARRATTIEKLSTCRCGKAGARGNWVFIHG